MYNFSKLAYKVSTVIGHNSCAVATSNPCERLVEISGCLLRNLRSQPLPGSALLWPPSNVAQLQLKGVQGPAFGTRSLQLFFLMWCQYKLDAFLPTSGFPKKVVP